MDTRDGSIHMIPDGQPVPKHMVPLGNLPNKDCPICKGKGKIGPKVVGKKHKRRFVYEPCSCTNPIKNPMPMAAPAAFGAFGEKPQPEVKAQELAVTQATQMSKRIYGSRRTPRSALALVAMLAATSLHNDK